MASGSVGSLDQLPMALLACIMSKLDISSICSLSVTCRTFNSCASHILSFLPNFHILVSSILLLSFSCSIVSVSLLGKRKFWYFEWCDFLFFGVLNWVTETLFLFFFTINLQDISPSMDLIKPLLPPNPYLQSLKLDCSQLNDSSIDLLLRPSLHELCLHNCAHFSGKLLSKIGLRCKDIRYKNMMLKGWCYVYDIDSVTRDVFTSFIC